MHNDSFSECAKLFGFSDKAVDFHRVLLYNSISKNEKEELTDGTFWQREQIRAEAVGECDALGGEDRRARRFIGRVAAARRYKKHTEQKHQKESFHRFASYGFYFYIRMNLWRCTENYMNIM